MRFNILLAALLFLLIPFFASAQEKTSAKIPRVLILLDGSSSMAEDWGSGRTRFQQAGKFILALIDSLGKANEEVEFGLRVFGHQYPAQQKNCYDTKLEIKFSRYNTSQMQARLEALHGYGVSPIAFSLQEAATEDFENENKYAYSIILVTDGGESCEGDICKVVNNLLQRKIFFRPYIVSLVDYAPLKDLYACLGTFLTVSNEPQMPKTITKIVDAHREGFVRAKTGAVIPVMPEYKKPDTITIPITYKEEPKKIIPPVKKDTVIVPVKIKEEPKKVEPPIKRDTIVIPIKIKEEPKKIIPPIKQDTIVIPIKIKEPPKLQERDRRVYKSIKINTNLRTYKTIIIDPPTPEYLVVPPFKMADVGNRPPAPVERKKESSISPLRFGKTKPARSVLVVVPSPPSFAVPPFKMVALNIPPPETTAVAAIIKPKEEPKPVIKKIEKPIVKPAAKAGDASYVVEKTPSPETLVEVYFTDGNGKFYSTTPQILFTDSKTNTPAHKFYRTVNPDGEPDAVKTPSGTFNITVVGSDRTYLRNVEVVPNMKNKIIVTVNGGSLQFVWKDGDKSPVDKYYAVVKRNFVPQPMIKQDCDTILPYPPGNYHIEVNTLPPMARSTDLSFGAITTIQVEKPGKAQVTNINDLGKITFYYALGDKFVRFYQMTTSGKPGEQTLELLPGVYEVHYFLAPGLPEKIKTFFVKSNESTLLELQ